MLLRRVAVPRQTAPLRCGPKGGEAKHPFGGDAAQRGQLGGLRLGAEEIEIGANLVFHRVVVGQIGGAAAAAQVARGAALGRPVFQTLFDDEACCSRRDLDAAGQGGSHGRILGSARLPGPRRLRAARPHPFARRSSRRVPST